MKIVAVSDTHHKHYYIKYPKGDVLIHAGDFTYRGERIERMLIIDWLNHISKKYAQVVVIMGNHDINMSKSWYNEYCMVNKRIPNLVWLQDDWAVIENLKIYGSPYTPRFGDWGFGEPEEALAKRFNHIPKNTDILITHGPPRGILDRNKHGQPCGSTALYDKIKRIPNLKIHLFGHIHEDGGKSVKEGNTTFYNLSVLDENYQIKNKPTIIEV